MIEHWLIAVGICLYVIIPTLAMYALLSVLEWALERRANRKKPR